MEGIVEVINNLWGYTGVQVIVSHLLLNTVVAVGTAVKLNEFSFVKLYSFLKDILVFSAIYGVAKIFAGNIGLDWLSLAVFGLIETKSSASLLENLGLLGIPIPEAVRKLI